MESVIVGGGPAGLYAALHCRQCWPDRTVTLIESAGAVGYCNPLLPQFMAGQVEEEKLYFWRPPEDPRLQIRTGAAVQSVERSTRTLVLGNQEKVSYERLILAPGGKPVLPPLGKSRFPKGVFPVRDLPGAIQIRQWLPEHPEIAVLGGGLVGVKTAVYLKLGGYPITLVEKEEQVLPQALTAKAAKKVEDHLQRMGIRLVLGSQIESLDEDQGNLAALNLPHRRISCRTLLVAAGSKPNVSFLEGSGLLKDGELPVSPTLQTSDANIFAAGDAVTIVDEKGQKMTPWTWPQAVSQGKLAAANLYSPAPLPLHTRTRSNSMNLQDLPLAALGARVPGAEAFVWETADTYREIFVRDGRIVGGALVGEIVGAGLYHTLMIEGKEVGEEGGHLLRPSFPSYPRRFFPQARRQRRQARFLYSEE